MGRFVLAELQRANRKYPYMEHLRVLNGRRPEGSIEQPPTSVTLQHRLQQVRSLLVWQEWERALATHPDREYVEYVLRGMREGFREGYQYRGSRRVSARRNMKSASENPEVVDKYIMKEVELGRIIGPADLCEMPSAHVSRFGVIPKNHQPGKWRLIVDLSHPEGGRVNDGNEPELCLPAVYIGG